MKRANIFAFSPGIPRLQQLGAWSLTARSFDGTASCDGIQAGTRGSSGVHYSNARFSMNGAANGVRSVSEIRKARVQDVGSEYAHEKAGYMQARQSSDNRTVYLGDAEERLSSDAPERDESDNSMMLSLQDLAELERDYKTAKSEYKEAKAMVKEGMKRAKDGNSSFEGTISEEVVTVLERAYREKKAAYKRAKEMVKTKEMAKERHNDTGIAVQNGATRTVTDDEPRMPATNRPADSAANGAATVTVCGSKTCTRMGSHAVAAMLGSSASLVAKCMDRCGGVGPSVRLKDGRVVKVDFRNAIRKAVEGDDITVITPPPREGSRG